MARTNDIPHNVTHSTLVLFYFIYDEIQYLCFSLCLMIAPKENIYKKNSAATRNWHCLLQAWFELLYTERETATMKSTVRLKHAKAFLFFNIIWTFFSS